MGLLDEAIREHLELKCRRGADPGEIAREEREALEPVFPDEPRPPALADEPQASVLDEEPPHGDPLAEAVMQRPAPAEEQAAPPATTEGSMLGEETAELDMEAVLEQDARLSQQATAAPVAAQPQGPVAIEDELDWEIPGRSDPPPEPIPGQERLTFE
jgi:hypothetical protein